MPIYTTDQIGQHLVLLDFPKRIVSLVPSQTELLFDLGLANWIVGVTRFCVHPEPLVGRVTKVGGTKQLHFDIIEALRPDIIIANKEENNREDIFRLQEHCPVWVSDVNTLEDAYGMMLELGRFTNTFNAAQALTDTIRQGFYTFTTTTAVQQTCAYFIWRKPYMVAANNTFIHFMLGQLGLRNVFERQTRYPEVTASALADLRPDIIFLSSEPYAFGEKHIDEFRAMAPRSKVIIVDGEMFSWYGSRLKLVPDYFAGLRREIL